jgi:hypothetical protein
MSILDISYLMCTRKTSKANTPNVGPQGHRQQAEAKIPPQPHASGHRPPPTTVGTNGPLSDPRFNLTDPSRGLAIKVNPQSEIGRSGLIVTVGGHNLLPSEGPQCTQPAAEVAALEGAGIHWARLRPGERPVSRPTRPPCMRCTAKAFALVTAPDS